MIDYCNGAFWFFQEGNLGKSDSSGNQEETPIIESNAESNESSKAENVTEAVGCDERSGTKEETVKITKKDMEQKVCGNLTFLLSKKIKMLNLNNHNYWLHHRIRLT